MCALRALSTGNIIQKFTRSQYEFLAVHQIETARIVSQFSLLGKTKVRNVDVYSAVQHVGGWQDNDNNDMMTMR